MHVPFNPILSALPWLKKHINYMGHIIWLISSFENGDYYLTYVVRTAAEAPSVKNEELAAVTVPCGLMKAAFNCPILSMVLTLIPLSSETVPLPGTAYGITSVRRPPC